MKLSIMYFEIALVLQYGAIIIFFMFLSLLLNFSDGFSYDPDIMTHFNKILLFSFGGRIFFFLYFNL